MIIILLFLFSFFYASAFFKNLTELKKPFSKLYAQPWWVLNFNKKHEMLRQN
jgi:hypothetical protein